MPAETPVADRPSIRPAHDQRRRSERRECNMAAMVRSDRGELGARITNLSADGCGLRIDTLLALKPGQRLLLVHPRLGEVPCILRWAMHPSYGAEFTAGMQARGRVHALYDTLPPATGDLA